MKSAWLVVLGLAVVTVSFMNPMTGSSDEPAAADSSTVTGRDMRSLETESKEDAGVSIEVARHRAQVMHDIYAATLEVMHHRYFHGERAIVPARAMEDVFAEIKQQSKTEARWISASMEPMSVNHRPTTDFEKRVAKEIAKGTEHVEIIEDGYYRRAGAIPLGGGCVGCHGGFFKPQSKTREFAGLVISVPIRQGGTADSK